ncbi:histone protein [Streptomyces sp. NPDC002917]|uniref:histone protein n=1 Tax=Streptomyces sp. NPDC002917 TaxID=3364671 RepID=UPI0036B4640E
MDNQTKVPLAAAIVGGYLLGRTKKGKLALSVATYLAGRRFGLEPRQLATEGMRRLGEIPQVAELQDQLKGEFLEAGRKAVTAAATRGVGTLAETLSERTASLGKKEEEKPKDEEDEEEPKDEEDEKEPEEEEEEPEEEEEEPEEEEEEPEDEEEGEEEEEEPEEPEPERPQRRRISRKSTRPEKGTASGRERAPSAGRKKSSATKPAAKKAAATKKSAARKQAPAKKAASPGRTAKKTSKHVDRRR